MSIRYALKPTVLSAPLVEEVVLLDSEGGLYYRLNEMAVRVWRLIGDGRTVGEIRAQLLDEFAVAPEQLDRDLVLLFSRLEELNLIVAVVPSASQDA